MPNVNMLLLPGDGIGPEITAEVEKVIGWFNANTDYDFVTIQGLLGGAAIDATGEPCPQETLDKVDMSDVVFLGAVGGPKWDNVDPSIRCEKGLLKLRKHMDVFANLRPTKIFSALAEASSMKPEVMDGVDLLIVRELVSGIYFGAHNEGDERASDEMLYTKEEVTRIARVAFELARAQGKGVCSVDKANVLAASRLWRKTVIELHEAEFSDVELSHMYVDNASMQLVTKPNQFDIVVTGNMFGDILSDTAGAMTGSLGMLPSASLSNPGKPGLFEPIHGSAPDIAGQGIANPLASILSLGMVFSASLQDDASAKLIETAVEDVLAKGFRTGDIAKAGEAAVSTVEMGDAVINSLARLAQEATHAA